MEKTITTALLVIAGIIAAVALINAVLPAANKGSGALLMANAASADRIKTDVEIVFASGNATGDEINFWVKNVGSNVIKPIDESDVFVTTPTIISRIPYNASCTAGSAPCWKHALEGGATAWTLSATVKVSVYLSSGTAGLHKIKIAVYNSVSAEKEFSI